MKTEVSLPDDLFQQAEAAALRLNLSRSQLYATAIAEFLERHRAETITERLNKVYARRRVAVDPALNRAQLESIETESW